MNVTDLTIFGWNEFFETNFESFAQNGYSYGRVTLEHKTFAAYAAPIGASCESMYAP